MVFLSASYGRGALFILAAERHRRLGIRWILSILRWISKKEIVISEITISKITPIILLASEPTR